MRYFKGKENINTMLNIDNIFGDYETHGKQIIITVVIAIIPPIIWILFLQGTPVKLSWVLIGDLFLTIYAGLEIIGNGPEKRKNYLEQKSDKGVTADEIITLASVEEEGLIQYDNGRVAYLISGYLKSYLTDDKLSVDVEHFMDELDMWDWDYYLHNSTDDLLCEDNLPKLKRYTDEEVIKERIDFYAYQDEWSRTHTGLYRITFKVETTAANWRKMKSHLTELLESDIATCFNDISILSYNEVLDICNRDIAAFADLRQMLMRKYDNEQYFDSKVVWYDDKIPENLRTEEDKINMDERRN